MFLKRKLDKWVAEKFISPKQKQQILEFEEKSGVNLIRQALVLLAIATIGIGIISLVAANWHEISSGVKLFVMFAVLFGTAGMAFVWQVIRNENDLAERALVALCLFCGAAIGLIIQVFQLSGGEIYAPLGVWCFITAPLLVAAKKKYVAYLWMPLFLVWCWLYVADIFEFDKVIEYMAALYLMLSAIGWALNRYVPKLLGSDVLCKMAMKFFYVALFVSVCMAYFSNDWFWIYVKAAAILVLLSLAFKRLGDYDGVRRNIKVGGLFVVMFYICMGGQLGLFNTGLGLIVCGVGLLALVTYLPKVIKIICGEKKNA